MENVNLVKFNEEEVIEVPNGFKQKPLLQKGNNITFGLGNDMQTNCPETGNESTTLRHC
jgi:hypothetical protein